MIILEYLRHCMEIIAQPVIKSPPSRYFRKMAIHKASQSEMGKKSKLKINEDAHLTGIELATQCK
jgi:hypothetical protein